MMVNQRTDDPSHVVVALQIDHSRVAGYLAAHWGNDDFSTLSPYPSMVLVAQEHDNGWWDWEVAPTISDEGEPFDYIGSVRHLGDDVWVDLARKGVSRLRAIDPYAALLAQMHAEGLLTQGKGLLRHMPDQTDVPGVKEFLAEGEVLRAEVVDGLCSDPAWAPWVEPEALWRNFTYLEVFDQMGQYVCNRYPFDSTARTNGPSAAMSDVSVPVRPGEPDTRLTFRPLDHRRAQVEPYPFDVDPLPVSFPARLLPRRPFADRSDFLGAFYRAERISVDYQLQSDAP